MCYFIAMTGERARRKKLRSHSFLTNPSCTPSESLAIGCSDNKRVVLNSASLNLFAPTTLLYFLYIKVSCKARLKSADYYNEIVTAELRCDWRVVLLTRKTRLASSK